MDADGKLPDPQDLRQSTADAEREWSAGMKIGGEILAGKDVDLAAPAGVRYWVERALEEDRGETEEERQRRIARVAIEALAADARFRDEQVQARKIIPFRPPPSVPTQETPDS